MLKLPRTIRLDPSDTFVFERAAEPGEWAVSASFLFMDTKLDELATKQRHGLRSGFLGAASLGFSTLCTIVEASEEEYETAVAGLAKNFHEKLGAPNAESALEASRAEFAFARGLCDHPAGTLIAVNRAFDETGALREQFRTLRPREANADQDRLHAFARAFTFHEVEDATQDMADEQVNLLALGKDEAK